MRRGRLLTLTCAIGIAGCASVEVSTQKLDTAKNCCRSPAEFRYVDYSPKQELPVEISEDSPVFDFPSGRSFFHAVRLTTVGAPSQLRVKVHASGLGAGIAFCPSLTFLTTQFDLVEMKYVQPQWQAPGLVTRGFYFADYSIPPDTAYIVVHSESRRIGEKLSLTQRTYNPAFGAVQLLFPGGPTETRQTPCAPAGSLTIEAQPGG
jgi:hypothetical protein